VRVSNAGKCEASSQGIQITVNLPDTLQRDTTACGFFSWQGSNYTIDTVLVSAPQNCLVTVWNVGIQPFVTQLRDTSACGRLVLNGITYTSNAQEITDTIGCTRRGWNISIQPYIRDTTSASACGSYVWKGRTLSSTGFYADTVACLVTVLKLKINSATFSSLTQTAIGSYTWNGQTYTSSGTYSWTGTNAAGCDSTATLILTILPESNPGPLQYQAIQEKLGACVNSPVKLSIKTLPRISTDSVKVNVNGDATTAYGNILNDGGKTITRRGFCWGISANPSLSNSFSENGSGLGIFIGTLSGLNANTSYYIRAYAGTATEVWYGNEINFTASGSSSSGNGLTDIDGNTYGSVIIGNQEWMSENLKVDKYRNGDAIPTGLDNAAWQNTTSGANAIYENRLENNSTYGKLYNWYAVADPRALCPTGWHIPTEHEWNLLTLHLDPAADTIECCSNNAGGKLKSIGTLQNGSGLWNFPNTNASNISGFSGIPAGGRNIEGAYANQGLNGGWWSSGNYSSENAWALMIGWDTSYSFRFNYYKSYGFSVRCLKD
jgi:uncharacterized protein (TIGR02145 family)